MTEEGVVAVAVVAHLIYSLVLVVIMFFRDSDSPCED